MRLMTLIPAFKVKYLPELLASLERQTLRADAVLVSDDSPNGDFIQALQSPAYAARAAALGVQVVQGPRQGAYANLRHLVQLWAGRSAQVHLLFDDDIIYPEFYERHLAMHSPGRFMATVSLRWLAEENGQPFRRARVPAALLMHPHKRLSLDASLAFSTSVGECVNWFGEFSNIVLHADHVPFLVSPQIAGVPVIGLEDLGTVLGATLQGPIGMLNEHLGYFRSSPQQATQQVQGAVMKLSTCAWVPLALAGRRLGHLNDAQVQRCAATMGGLALGRYADDPALAALREPLAALVAGDAAAEGPLLAAWTAYAASQVPHAVQLPTATTTAAPSGPSTPSVPSISSIPNEPATA